MSLREQIAAALIELSLSNQQFNGYWRAGVSAAGKAILALPALQPAAGVEADQRLEKCKALVDNWRIFADQGAETAFSKIGLTRVHADQLERAISVPPAADKPEAKPQRPLMLLAEYDTEWHWHYRLGNVWLRLKENGHAYTSDEFENVDGRSDAAAESLWRREREGGQ